MSRLDAATPLDQSLCASIFTSVDVNNHRIVYDGRCALCTKVGSICEGCSVSVFVFPGDSRLLCDRTDIDDRLGDNARPHRVAGGLLTSTGTNTFR